MRTRLVGTRGVGRAGGSRSPGVTRILRPVAVAAVALGLGVTASCVGSAGTTAELGSDANAEPARRAGPTPGASVEQTQPGDTSPRKVVEAGGTKSRSTVPTRRHLGPSPSATTGISLPPLDQPEQRFGTPGLPDPPAKDADELTHIAYKLKVRVWNAAGVVGEDTEADCDIDEDDLIEEGTHEFECEIEMSGVAVKFDVEARVTETKVHLSSTTNYLPVSEKKAEHESTRQAFKPARVACDVVGLEALRVGERDGFVCWVTDIDNNQRQYEGEMLPNGQLAVRRSTPDVEEQTKQEDSKDTSGEEGSGGGEQGSDKSGGPEQ